MFLERASLISQAVLPAGIGTMNAGLLRSGCRRIDGPVPPLLLIRVLLLFNWQTWQLYSTKPDLSKKPVRWKGKESAPDRVGVWC